MQTLSKNSALITHKPPIKSLKAPKYDINWIASELKDLLDTLTAHPDIKSKAQLFRMKDYSSSRFYRYKAKYPDHVRTQEYIKKIEEILESRLIEQGLTGKNFPFVIFLLKNHYGYQDKREVEQETTHVFKVTRGDTKKVIDVAPAVVSNIQRSPHSTL